MDRPNTIGQLLKNIHIQRINEEGRTLNQNELAAWFGIDSQLFNKYYNDKRTPEGDNLDKIADKAGSIVYVLVGHLPPELRERISRIPSDKYDELGKAIDDFMSDLGLGEE